MSAPVALPRKMPRPSINQVQPENIPEEQRLRRNWVVARNKIPLMPDGRPASCSDPKTWVDFDTALKAYQRGVGDALWLALDGVPREDGLVLAAIDLDSVESTQERLDAARRMLTSLNTYWEQSPSGKGLRAICWARPLPSGKNSDGIELYTSKRFVSITGAVVPGRRSIADCAEKFEQLVPAPHGGIAGTPLPCSNVDNSALMAGLDNFPPLPLEEIRRAALAIPAGQWQERGDWWRLVSALAYEAVMRPADADGLKQIMHDASSRPGAFEAAFGAAYDSAANDEEWEKALRDTRKRMSNSGRAITLGTLLYEATSHGWVASHEASTTKQGVAMVPSIFAYDIANGFETIEKLQPLHGSDLFRRVVTNLSAPGGAGKSTIVAAICAAMATRRPLLNETPPRRLRVIHYNAEDGRGAVMRPYQALAKKHQINPTEFHRHLFVLGAADARLDLTAVNPKSRTAEVNQATFATLSKWIEEAGADVLVLDPLVAMCPHDTNDNALMAAVMRQLTEIAVQYNCAIMVVQHTRKTRAGVALDPADPNQAAGAAALINMARVAIGVTALEEAEGEKLGLPIGESWRFRRLADLKANLAAKRDHRLIELEGVCMTNAQPPEYPDPDWIPVALPFTPMPGAGGQIPLPALRACLVAIAQGQTNSMPWGMRTVHTAIADALCPHLSFRAQANPRATAQRTLNELTGRGWLIEATMKVPKQSGGGGSYKRKGYKAIWSATPWSCEPLPGVFSE